MLTMLPKFALVVIDMYFSVEDDVGALARHVHGLFDGDADIGSMQSGRIVDAVSDVAHRVSGALERAHDPFLLLRIDLHEHLRARRQVP
jgi:hypothetical protein